MEISTKQLSECPEYMETVGIWIYEQWWRTPDNSPEVVLSLLRTHTEKDTVPFTIVALKDDVPINLSEANSALKLDRAGNAAFSNELFN